MISTWAAVFLGHAECLIAFHYCWARHLRGGCAGATCADQIARDCGLRAAPREAGGVAPMGRA